MVGETTWFSQLDVQLFLLLVGGLVTPFLMESSAHLKKKWRPTSSTLVRKLSVMMDLTMRSRDSKKRDATWRVFSCLLTPLKWEKRWSSHNSIIFSSHWPWSESKIRWKDELTQELLLAAYLEFCSSSNFLCVPQFHQPQSWCLKITEKVSFNIASEASYVYILSGQKSIKNAKNGPFWRIFENLNLAVKQCYQTGQF